MATRKKRALTPEMRLEAALVPEGEWPYEVPDNWCWVRVGSINSYKSSSVDPRKTPDKLFELYSVPSLAEDYPEIIAGSEIGSTKQSVHKDDVLLCKINPRINRVWKVSKYTDETLIASSEWVVIRSAVYEPDFLMRCLSAHFFREQLLSHVSGVGGSLMRAQPRYIKDYVIPLPPLHEQRRIASRIEWLFAKLDDAEAELREVIDSSEQRLAAILHKAFTGELVSLGDDSERSRLHVPIRKVVSGLKYGTSEKSTYDNEGMPVLRIPNVSSLYVDLNDMKYLAHSDVKPADMLQKGDILMIRSNGSRDLVGRCAVVPTLEEEYTYASFLIRIRPSDRVDSKYLWYYLQSTDAKAQLFTKAKSSSGIHNINSKEIGATIMPLPAMDKQHAIVQALDALFDSERDVLSTATIALDRIRMTRESVLNKALRGELGTNDPGEASSKELLASIMSGNADK